jgi:hypothetical protein
VNEVEEMRDALDRAERNLDRMRWIITHPAEAHDAIGRALMKGDGDVVQEIDLARKNG